MFVTGQARRASSWRGRGARPWETVNVFIATYLPWPLHYVCREDISQGKGHFSSQPINVT